MLNNRILDDRTFEQRYQEALNNIPLYTKEWTNFNPSDPGITTLETILAFLTMQQDQMDRITPQVKKNLLKMVGMEPAKERCARVLLSTDGLTETMTLPAGHVFSCSDTVFETGKITTIYPYSVTGVYRKDSDGLTPLHKVMDRELDIAESVFGAKPKEGDCIYFTVDGLPEPSQEIIFYIRTMERMSRNPFPDKGRNLFSDIVWECYTEDGFEKMNTLDRTEGFLMDGDVRMRLPAKAAAPCPECGNSFCIRARVLFADYDVEPRICDVEGFLFELYQKETLSACITSNMTQTVSIYNNILDLGYVNVFVKEERGGSYHLYKRAPFEGAQGRFFDYENSGPGMHRFTFDKKKYGYGPCKVRDGVRVLGYTEPIMRQYSLGVVYGYDGQEMDLPSQNVVGEGFCILARRDPPKGPFDMDGGISASPGYPVGMVDDYIYDFLRPGMSQDGALSYRLLENEGRIIIDDPGDYIGASLYVGALAITRGSEGNIRAGNDFVSTESGMEITFNNPGPATGGRYRESLEDVRRRFLEDIRTPYSAVTKEDYEWLVKTTPELIIHKVRAFCSEDSRNVRIAVKPGTDEEFPRLSAIYKESIMKRLEERRLLNTTVRILEPMYLPVEIRGTVFVRENYGNALKLIEESIRREVDYMRSDKNFGDPLLYSDVFHAIEELDCVKFVRDLHLTPQLAGMSVVTDGSIYPENNCLCYVGSISIETATLV